MTAGSDDDKGIKASELSLDPSTWLKGSAAEPAKADESAPAKDQDSETVSNSFDPSTWAKPGQAPETVAASSPPTQAAPSRRLMLAGGGAGLVVAAGGGLWLMTRKGSSGPGPSAGVTERQVLTLPDVASVGQALVSYGLSAEASGQIVTALNAALPASNGELRMELELARARKGAVSLVSLALSRPDGSGAKVLPNEKGFVATAMAASTRMVVKVARGQMDAQSFYSSAVSAGLSDVLIPDFFQAFVYDFDFQREIEPGDVFEAAFEQTVNARDEAVGAKRLIYAAMTTRAKSRALYSFAQPGEKGASWFDGAGKNIRRSLMKTPVEGARISSTFGIRNHPVLGYTRMHKGTDFATPIGTPVFASGAGKVSFSGVHGGHGNYVAVEHSPTLTTSYAHLSAYAEGVAVGAPVAQGQQVALTGNTGVSSGPHLHYEVLVNGEQVDSQSFQTEEGHALTGLELTAFGRERDRIDTERANSL